MLAKALDDLAPEFPQLQLTLLTTADGASEIAPRNLDVRLPPGPLRRLNAGPARLAIEQLVAAAAGGDLLHFFDLSGPVLSPWRPFTTTVHDAGAAHGFGRRGYAYKRLLCPWALRRARAAVAVSAFARDEAVRYFGADSAKIRVIHSGPGLEPADHEPHARTQDPFLLFVGNLGGNKNLPSLIAAFERADIAGDLVLAGRSRPESESALRRAIALSPAAARIRVLPDATDDDLELLYRGATALVLPSRYEGFGFTALEAMARGCPVIASDIPALREVAGPGALLLPLDDAGAWADALRRVAGDHDLRAELRARGADNVARYSWTATASGVLQLLAEASGARTP